MVCKVLKITLLPGFASVSSVSPLVIHSFKVFFFKCKYSWRSNKLCSYQTVTPSLVTLNREGPWAQNSNF